MATPARRAVSTVWTGGLLLVDGHAYAYRAFHAIRHLTSPQGLPTNAIYGFIKMTLKLRALLEPERMAVVWDGGLAAERLAELPGYKAQRPAMPEALAVQLDEIAAWLQAMGIASLCRDGAEADDWLAAIAHQTAREGGQVIIASSDKDFMQLVCPQIGLFNPNDKSETIWADQEVRTRTGVEPAQIVDWLSLIGDAVDNIPGVPGVGPKTATDLLRQFGSVESLYQRLAEVKSERLRQALISAQPDVRRNQRLIRLPAEFPESFSLNDLAQKKENPARLLELYQRWGFHSLQRELAAVQPPQTELF